MSSLLLSPHGRSRRERDRDLPGIKAEVQVLDYVLHEVLAGEDPDLVGALMEVSVVDRGWPEPGSSSELAGPTPWTSC